MSGDSGANGVACWGIYRELAHSPGRETDDAEILRSTARRLEGKGFRVSLRTAEEIAASTEGPPPFLFVMCERLEILRRLEAWAERGACLVNSPSAIRNTYRDRMLPLFRQSRVPFPASVIVPTSSPIVDAPAFSHASEGCWIKRGDVHATGPQDVVFAPDPRTAARALKEMSARGIGNALLQAHVPGDLIKFYGVGDVGHRATGGGGDDGHGATGDAADGGAWFEWFYHRDQRLEKHPFRPADLAAAAARAAASLGLEVFGGDAIATRDGSVFVIDVNAWPSFALYRETASERIASYLAARFRGHVAIGVTE